METNTGCFESPRRLQASPLRAGVALHSKRLSGIKHHVYAHVKRCVYIHLNTAFDTQRRVWNRAAIDSGELWRDIGRHAEVLAICWCFGPRGYEKARAGRAGGLGGRGARAG